MGVTIADGNAANDDVFLRRYAEVQRQSAEWERQEAARQAAVEAARRSNARDPYDVGTGSSGSFGNWFGRPSGGRSRKSKKSKKSRRSRRR